MCTNIARVLIIVQLIFTFILARKIPSRSRSTSPIRRYDPNGFPFEDSNFTCLDAHKPPEIKIEPLSYWPGNGKSQNYQDLTLECTAAYPVYWDYVPSKSSIHFMSSQVSVNPTDSNSVNYCYKEQLRLMTAGSTSSYGRTGNYTCRSSIDSTISSSFFVYSKDNDRVFSCPASSVTYSSIVNGSEWLIPCPANLEDEFLNVTLSTMVVSTDVHSNNSGSGMDYLTMYPVGDPSIRYDSRYGFLLKTSNHSRPIGMYSCETTTHGTTFFSDVLHETVDIHLIDFNVIPSTNYVTYVNGSHITVTCESDEDITINIEHSYKLALKSSTLKKTSAFNFSITYILEETADPAATVGSTEGEISCRVISTNKILHTWKHDVSKLCNAYIVNERPQRDFDPYYNNFQSRAYSFIYFNNPNNQRMKVRYTTCINAAKCELDIRFTNMFDERNVNLYGETYHNINMHLQTASIILCEVETNYTTAFLAVQTINEISLNPYNVTSEEKINVTKMYGDMDEIFVGDSVPFLCKLSDYFYSSGTSWKFLYKNGTESLIKVDNTTELDNPNYMNYMPSGTAIVLKIGDSNITGVACSARVWNSTIWESGVFKLDIKDREIWDENATVRCDGGYHKPTIVLKRQQPYYYMHPYHDRYGRYRNRESNIKLASHIVTDTDFVVSRRNFEFLLICIAKYPVKWSYQGRDNYFSPRGGPDGRYGGGNSGKGTIRNDTLHHCFQTTIYGNAYQSTHTGEYLCEKVNDAKISAYLYLFANLSPASPLVDEGEHKTVYVDPKASQVYIPCKVTDPLAKLDLYYHEDHGMYKKLNDSYYINYDPKKGFLMEKAALNFSSIYICTSQNRTDSTDAVSFTFALNETEEVTSAEARMDTSNESEKSLLVTNFVFLFLLIISVIGLQLWFLRKQFKLDVAMTRIFGTYINLEPEIATSNNEFQSNYHVNGNTQLIPSLF